MALRLLSLLVGYAFGNLLTADAVSRRLTGHSVFELGDGNPGMANVGHELGVGAATAVLAGDILKTVLAFILARALFAGSDPTAAGIWASTGATLGHNFPFWHRFRGGKGVTTSCSAIILSSPIWGTISCLLGLATVLLGGYLCWGAVAITLAYLLFACFSKSTDILVSAALLLVLMWLAHGRACLGVRTGDTPRAGLSDAFWRALKRPRNHE